MQQVGLDGNIVIKDLAQTLHGNNLSTMPKII